MRKSIAAETYFLKNFSSILPYKPSRLRIKNYLCNI